MANFRVRDLDAMAAQLRAAGIEVDVAPEPYPNGRFAHLKDPRAIPSSSGNLWTRRLPSKGGETRPYLRTASPSQSSMRRSSLIFSPA